MKSGFAVMGDVQYLPGYSLLLAYPQIGQLNDLSGSQRQQFLQDMAALGDAIRAATGCKRINYSIYGNLDPFLHAHAFPRYEWESAETSTQPPMMIPAQLQSAPEHAFSLEAHGELMALIRAHLVI